MAETRRIATISKVATSEKCVKELVYFLTSENLRLSCNFSGKAGKPGTDSQKEMPKVPDEFLSFIGSCMQHCNPETVINSADICLQVKKIWTQAKDTARKRAERFKKEPQEKPAIVVAKTKQSEDLSLLFSDSE